MKQHVYFSASLMVMYLLTGCGGDDEISPTASAEVCRNAYGNGQLLTADPRLRAANSDVDFVGSIQSYLASVNCVRTATTQQGRPELVGAPSAPTTGPGATPVADSSRPPSSETNTQERGVDEADLVESDGEFLFIATSPNIVPIGGGIVPGFFENDAVAALTPPQSSSGQADPHVRIMRLTSAPAAATALATIELPGVYQINGLYLRRTADGKRQLSVLISDALGAFVRAYDVTDPVKPSVMWEWKTDGYILSSRRIDNQLYVVSQFYPFVGPPFDPLPLNAERIAANSATISQLNSGVVLPDTTFNGEPRNTITANDCFVPVAADPVQRLYPVASVVFAWRVDLDNPEAVKSFCTLDTSGSVYASTNALYLLRHDLDASVVHKISFVPEGFRYAGSASVPGTVMRADSFQLSEHNGDLRIVTTQMGTSIITVDGVPFDINFQASELKHRLFVLRESGAADNLLRTVAELPNPQHPEVLGKPNEQLFAVRFVGPRAYLVTFLRKDPFYVVDLSNPAEPFVAGELQLPGFSDYLHPFGASLILGVGHEATDTGQTMGVKVGLFDVSNPAAPRVVGSQVIGQRGSSTPISYDHHAFTVLESGIAGTHRVAVPVDVYETPSPFSSDFFNWTYSGLFLFEVSEATGQQAPKLVQTGTLTAQRATNLMPDSNPFGLRRSVIAGDDVHFVSADQVWSAPWSDPKSSIGPQ